MRISVAPNHSGVPDVKISEATPLGSMGTQLRASVWLAAAVAAQAAGRPLRDYSIDVHVPEYVEGASGGATFAAGMLAAMCGATVRQDARIAATVLPNGLLGSAVALPEKFDGAIAAGATKLGYPVGHRNVPRRNGAGDVDLQAFAKQRGAQAYPVRDVYEAFALITGFRFSAPTAALPADMALPPRVEKELIAQSARVRRSTHTFLKTLPKSSKREKHYPTRVLTHLKGSVQAAEQNNGPLALTSALLAWDAASRWWTKAQTGDRHKIAKGTKYRETIALINSDYEERERGTREHIAKKRNSVKSPLFGAAAIQQILLARHSHLAAKNVWDDWKPNKLGRSIPGLPSGGLDHPAVGLHATAERRLMEATVLAELSWLNRPNGGSRARGPKTSSNCAASPNNCSATRKSS